MSATFRDLEGTAAPVLARMWWAVLLRAVAAILFAVLAFYWLGRSLPALALLFAAYAVLDGFLSLTAAIRGGGVVVRSGLALAGAVSIVAGAAAGLWPGLTWPILALIIGAWAVVRGGLEVAGALKLRRVMQRDWSLAMIGGLSVVFGVLLIAGSGMDPWTLVRLLSAYALILGLLLSLLAFRFLKSPRP